MSSSRNQEDSVVYNVTGADTSLSQDQAQRIKTYTIQMVIRTLCFVLAFFASGWLRWAFVIAAIVLPYIAVVWANNTRVVSTTYLDPVPEQNKGLGGATTQQADSETPHTKDHPDVGPNVIVGEVKDETIIQRQLGNTRDQQ